MNKIVAHFQDGQVAKGLTVDFNPAKERFHLLDENGVMDAPKREIALADLKGLYFVRDLEGDLGHAKSNIFDPQDLTPGSRIRVTFKDGEVMHGITQGYTPGRAGFFMVPADRKSNTQRCYVNTSAASDIVFL